jgi:hypothetical protein
VSTYQPIGSVLAVAPIYVLLVLASVWIAAGLERAALRSVPGTLTLVTLSALAWIGLRAFNTRHPSLGLNLDAEQQPIEATQRLGLND